MDVVEFFFVEPVVLHVVDFEAAVGWDIDRLDRTEICA